MIGQFNLGFIIGKLDEDLFIVDQVILANPGFDVFLSVLYKNNHNFSEMVIILQSVLLLASDFLQDKLIRFMY